MGKFRIANKNFLIHRCIGFPGIIIIILKSFGHLVGLDGDFYIAVNAIQMVQEIVVFF
jgi:hypothetical protein